MCCGDPLCHISPIMSRAKDKRDYTLLILNIASLVLVLLVLAISVGMTRPVGEPIHWLAWGAAIPSGISAVSFATLAVLFVLLVVVTLLIWIVIAYIVIMALIGALGSLDS